MFDECRNWKKQGDMGVGAAIAYFAMQGHTVLFPLSDSEDYDLVVDISGDLLKIQVRTTQNKSKYGIFEANLKVCGGNTKRNYVHKTGNMLSYDLLFVLTSDGDQYLLPKEEIKDLKSKVCLGEKYQHLKIN